MHPMPKNMPRSMRDRTAAGYFHQTKLLAAIMAGLALLLAAPAHAIVGGGAPSAEGVGRSVITIVGSRGNFCG